MRIDLVSREYPPNIYGGAGVHVAQLHAALSKLTEVQVHAFGEPEAAVGVHGYATPAGLASANGALQALGTDIEIAAALAGTDVVHSHTWYANFAGHLASLMYDVPHVISAHSLEPMRPWKAEQLAGGYRVSSWAESTAYHAANAIIAVSHGMRQDILNSYPEVDPNKVKVVHNGIDVADWFPDPDEQVVRDLGIDPERPSVVFVGRVTRQKGLPYLLRAALDLDPDVQLVLCAGAADTPELAQEVQDAADTLREQRGSVVWIERMLPRSELRAVLSAATVFVCPSVYEPLGIVNLEAMACEVPVVGTATGGIPEVVADGSTGWLVPIEQVTDGTGTPVDPDKFVADLSATLSEAVSDTQRAKAFGRAGRLRCENEFTWDAIAQRTMEVYRSVL